MKSVKIVSEYITLGQFLKFVGIIDNGAMAKVFLNEEIVLVNGEKETRRGRKLYQNDKIEAGGQVFTVEK